MNRIKFSFSGITSQGKKEGFCLKFSRLISVIVILFITLNTEIYSQIAYAQQGVVITLENTGPTPITEIVLGFDIPPIDPGQTLDVTIGNFGSPTNLGEFMIGGSPISRDNPLPPGGIACAGPFLEIIPGTTLEFDQVMSYGNGYSGIVSFFYNFPEIIPEVTILTFDYESYPVPRLAGIYRFLSEFPCASNTNILNAKVEIQLGPQVMDDTFDIKATLILGSNSDGVNLYNENIHIQIGAFSTTISAGFLKEDKKGRFEFDGIIDGIDFDVVIILLDENRIKLKIEGEGADLTGISNPVTVRFTIGNDSGTTTVKTKFKCYD